MAGLVNALQRHAGRAQALQAVALRTAAWGDAKEFGEFIGRLEGSTSRRQEDDAELDAALAAFGLRAE